MKIESIRLENFRSFREAEMRDVPRLCVLVGANGSGKSTFFSVFSFLKDALVENVHVALTRLGGGRGFREVRSRDSEGPIEIELKFRERAESPLITYLLAIDEESGSPCVRREILKYRRGSKGKPWHFLDFVRGEGTAVTNEPEEVQAPRAGYHKHRRQDDRGGQGAAALSGRRVQGSVPRPSCFGWHTENARLSAAAARSQTASPAVCGGTGEPIVPQAALGTGRGVP